MNAMITRWMVALVLIAVGSLHAMALESPQSEVAPAETNGGGSSLADALPDWVRNLKIGGDLRYRHEHKDDDSSSSERERHRIRARFYIPLCQTG